MPGSAKNMLDCIDWINPKLDGCGFSIGFEFGKNPGAGRVFRISFGNDKLSIIVCQYVEIAGEPIDHKLAEAEFVGFCTALVFFDYFKVSRRIGVSPPVPLMLFGMASMPVKAGK